MKLLILLILLILFSSCLVLQKATRIINIKDCVKTKCYYFWQDDEYHSFGLKGKEEK